MEEPQEVRTIKGTDYKCICGNSQLVFDHNWSDGMSKHYWYICRGCNAKFAVHANSKDEITRVPDNLEEV